MSGSNEYVTSINLRRIVVWPRLNYVGSRLAKNWSRREGTAAEGAATGTTWMVEAHAQGRFDMSRLSDSYVSRVLFATPATGRSIDVAAQRWRWLKISLFDSYRPELHYMRGPGPRWREKHGRGAKS